MNDPIREQLNARGDTERWRHASEDPPAAYQNPNEATSRQRRLLDVQSDGPIITCLEKRFTVLRPSDLDPDEIVSDWLLNDHHSKDFLPGAYMYRCATLQEALRTVAKIAGIEL